MQGRIADFVVEQPMVIGHESAGWVLMRPPLPLSLRETEDWYLAHEDIQVTQQMFWQDLATADPCRDVVGMGEGVSRLQMGARVALEPGIPCWGSKVAR